MEREEALDRLTEVQALVERSQRKTRRFWQLGVVWTLVSLGSIPLAAGGERTLDALRIYWYLAVPLGAAASYVLYRGRAMRTGPRPATVLIVALVFLITPVGSVAVFGALTASTTGTGGFVAAAAVASVIAWISKDRFLTVVGAFLFVLSASSWSFTSHAPLILASAFSAALGLATIIQRRGAEVAA